MPTALEKHAAAINACDDMSGTDAYMDNAVTEPVPWTVHPTPVPSSDTPWQIVHPGTHYPTGSPVGRIQCANQRTAQAIASVRNSCITRLTGLAGRRNIIARHTPQDIPVLGTPGLGLTKTICQGHAILGIIPDVTWPCPDLLDAVAGLPVPNGYAITA